MIQILFVGFIIILAMGCISPLLWALGTLFRIVFGLIACLLAVVGFIFLLGMSPVILWVVPLWMAWLIFRPRKVVYVYRGRRSYWRR